MNTHKGLTTAQVEKQRDQYGPNMLTAKSGNPWYKMLLGQFTDVLVLILVGAALLSFLVGEDHTDGYVIIGIVLLNAGIGFFQEFRTEKTLKALQNMVHPEIRVYRNGSEMLIATKNLVPGDIVILAEGDKVPADGKLLETHSLKIEESALTGESVPVEKKNDDTVYMGTAVARGSGVFQVLQTGMQTKFGNIAQLTTETKNVASPLQIELGRIGMFVAKITAVICIILFGVGLLRGFSLIESLFFSVSVAIAAVPEGLPTTITIALALGASILARKKAIIKKLSSVETLGAVTTICSDKTGTLTKNEMTVREIVLADGSHGHVSGVGYDPQVGQIHFDADMTQGKNTLMSDILTTCHVCNDAKLKEDNDIFTILGDPTEGALLTLAAKAKHHDFSFQENLEKDEIFPFDSNRKMMSVVAGGRVWAKGSPDQLLAQCTHISDGNKTIPLNEKTRERVQMQYTHMAQKALRVLAFAYKDVDTVPKDATQAEVGLVFVGFTGMIDPPRPEVQDAVETCRKAGIRVVVITGDYGETAKAIAHDLGILRHNKGRVITGAELETLSDPELSDILADRTHSVIFARSLPQHKMRIVKLLQEHGEIVAMTGDGVNDAPALKKANIGVAMGITGTEVSKEAATMILTNDSFASIVTAVEEGRRIYDNLKKFVWFIFSCNIGELFLIFASIAFGFPIPLTAVLILCVDLGTDILPAIALGVDTAEKDLMQRKPRDTTKPLMGKQFISSFLMTGATIGVAVTGAFLFTLLGDGWNFGDPTNTYWPHATTVAFVSLVIVQLVNAFSARSPLESIFRQNPFTNHFLVIAVLSSLILVLGMVYVPWANDLLRTVPLDSTDWGVVFVASFGPLGFVEAAKHFWRKENA